MDALSFSTTSYPKSNMTNLSTLRGIPENNALKEVREFEEKQKAMLSTMTKEQQEAYQAYRASYEIALRNARGTYSHGSLKEGYATLQTGMVGEGRVVLDLNNNDRVDVMGEYLNNNTMFRLDSNNDGILNSDDKYFDKLKLSITDDNGNEKLVKLSSIMSHIDLNSFIDQDKVAAEKAARKASRLEQEEKLEKYYDWSGAESRYVKKEAYIDDDTTDIIWINPSSFRRSANPLADMVDPKYTHKLFSDKQADAYFEKYADDEGWVQFKIGSKFGAVGEQSEYLNFAYTRTDANGNEYLQKFFGDGVIYDPSKGLEKYFNEFYDRVKAQISQQNIDNGALIEQIKAAGLDLDTESITAPNAMVNSLDTRWFKKSTGLEFSLENLQKVKSLVDQGKMNEVFKGSGGIVAMRKNDEGGYTLKFGSGKTLDVKELYYDTGDFVTLEGDKDKRASLLMNDELKPLDKNNDDQIDKSEIDFNNYAIEKDGKLQTLQNAGVNSINLIRGGPQGTDYYMEMVFNEENKDDSYQTLYKITDLSNPYKPDAMEKLKEYLNHPYQQNTLEEERAKVYEGRG